jgi:hypothetical protein
MLTTSEVLDGGKLLDEMGGELKEDDDRDDDPSRSLVWQYV